MSFLLTNPLLCSQWAFCTSQKKWHVGSWCSSGARVCERTFQTFLGGNSKPFRDIPKFIKLDKNKLINLENIIYKVINFKNINKGIKMFQGKSTGRIIVKF